MSINAYFHGASCCGISTLHLCGYESPEYVVSEVPTPSRNYVMELQRARIIYASLAHPEQTAGERADDFIRRLSDDGRRGLIEVVLITDSDCFDEDEEPDATQEAWIPWLKQRGFKKVNEFQNSNSGNTLSVFHLNTNQ